MPKLDARHVFQAVNIVDGLMGAAAIAHALPSAPSLAWIATSQAALAMACLCPRCPLVGPAIVSVPTAKPYVALTFDDGPDPALTPYVLDILAQYDAKASFFCIGERVRAHPALARAIAAAGHGVENHSLNHRAGFALLGSGGIAREVDHAQRLLADTTGQSPVFFRAPSGFRNPWLAPLLAARGLRYAAWSRRGLDTIDPDPARILRRVSHTVAPGSVLLLHDGRSARDRQGEAVLRTVLPRLLAELGERGLQAVDLRSLWRQRLRISPQTVVGPSPPPGFSDSPHNRRRSS